MKNKHLIVIGLSAFVFSLMFCGNTARPEEEKHTKSKYGLQTLVELAKSRAQMMKGFEAETQNYNKIKTAFKEGALVKGELALKIAEKYGQPSIVLADKDIGGGYKWIYKPGGFSFFSKEKIYLVFDAKNMLIAWFSPIISQP